MTSSPDMDEPLFATARSCSQRFVPVLASSTTPRTELSRYHAAISFPFTGTEPSISVSSAVRTQHPSSPILRRYLPSLSAAQKSRADFGVSRSRRISCSASSRVLLRSASLAASVELTTDSLTNQPETSFGTMRPETPNHALQRTAPRVTARAFCEPSVSYIWASVVRV